MRYVPTLALVSLVLGCSSHDHAVRIEADEQTVQLSDGTFSTTTSLTPRELDRIVRDYAAARQLDFDFRGLRANIVVPRSRAYLADVWYGGRIGEPVLSAKVGFDRRVFEHDVGIGVCGSARLHDPR